MAMNNKTMNDYTSFILSQRKNDQPFYLLVDPLKDISNTHELSISSLQKNMPEEHIFPIPRADLSTKPSKFPHLVLLTKPHQTFEQAGTKDIFDASAQYARQEHPSALRYVCGWLQTSCSPYELCETLAQRMFFDVRTSHNITQEHALKSDVRPHVKLYPLHQPLRLELMLSASYIVNSSTQLDSSQALSHWLHPISYWMSPTANKGLFYIDGKQSNQEPSALSQPPKICVQAQADADTVAHVLSLWLVQKSQPMTAQKLQQAPLLQRGKPLPEKAAFQCWLALRAGRQQGLKDIHDLSLFAMLRLITHPQFDLHPTIQNAVKIAASGQSSLAEQLSQIEHYQWLQILYELERS